MEEHLDGEPRGSFRGRFFQWTPDSSPAVIHRVDGDDDWTTLDRAYAPDVQSPPLARVFDIARAHRTRTVVVERRYIDADFRSSHEAFYAGTYRRYPSVCHRLHFFQAAFSDLRHIGEYRKSYIGFSVMHPLEWSPVGRTMLRPPPEFDGATMCLVRGTARLFGWTLTVDAMPFISQDQQFLRCAHAVQWMVLRHAHLRGRGRLALPADIHAASSSVRRTTRLVPSMGLSTEQVLAGLDELGLSAATLDIDFHDRKASRDQRNGSLFAILCRYVNSRMPPIVLSNRHAWVVVGYTAGGQGGHDDIVLIRHDDARGPYIAVTDPWQEEEPQHVPWRAAIIPYPRKVYVTAEKAEEIGRWWFKHWLRDAAERECRSLLADAVQGDYVHYRTYATDASDFKAGLRCRPVHPKLRDAYCYTQWPRHIWVVEAIDDRLRGRAADGSEGGCVLGEILLDATSHHLAVPERFQPLAVHVCGDVVVSTPDHDEEIVNEWKDFDPYPSGCGHDRLGPPT